MMEFTISRVVAIACGAILLAAVVSPFTGIMDDNENENYGGLCDDISEMVDAFYDSATERMTVSMDTVIPSGAELELLGHLVKLRNDGKEYVSTVRANISTDVTCTNADVIEMTKTLDGILITKM